MRQQIDSLPEGVVKQHMGKALAQLETELGMSTATPTGSTTKEQLGAASSTALQSEGQAAQPPAAEPGDETAQLVAQKVSQAAGVQVKGIKVMEHKARLVATYLRLPLSSFNNTVHVKFLLGTRQDALALAIHVIMLLEGFTCYAEEEEKGGPTGFAPPIRAVSPLRLVPSKWNADPANVCLTYRHDQLKGRDIKVGMHVCTDILLFLFPPPLSVKQIKVVIWLCGNRGLILIYSSL